MVVGEEGLAQGSAAGARGATVSDEAIRESHEVVLHADRAGRAVGSDRLERLGIRHHTLPASGTSEDVALLLADVRGASLIIAVGTHATLDEFLDRQRAGLASTFLTRLRVGPKLVDAKGVPQLYAGRVRLWHLLAVLLAGLLALGVAIAATPVGQDWWSSVGSDVLDWIRGLLSVISFRYHIVSIVSVFLALAIGVGSRRRPAEGRGGQHAGRPGEGRPAGEGRDLRAADRRPAQHQRVHRPVRHHRGTQSDRQHPEGPGRSPSWCCRPRSSPTSDGVVDW